MISEQARENGPASTEVSASGRPLSPNPDAKRKREARATKGKASGSSVSGRGGSEPKGNPAGFGAAAHMGEPLSAHEAERQLFYGHVGLAKAIRSNIDLSELKEEFEVAGENYAYVANHIWTPLRVVIRFIAPVVLVAVLVVIWGHMIAATPWIHSVRDWWARRGSDESTPPESPRAAARPAEPQSAADAGATQSEPPPPAPPIHRPHLTRPLSRRF